MHTFSRTGTEKQQAVGDMALIAFYNLLRVGEYTSSGTGKTTLTQAFRLQAIAGHLTTEEMNAFNVLKSGMSGSSLISDPSSPTTDTLGTRGSFYADGHTSTQRNLHLSISATTVAGYGSPNQSPKQGGTKSGYRRLFCPAVSPKKTAGLDKSSLPNSETSSSTGDWRRKTLKAANHTAAPVHYLS
jgi:hypothetical protein